MLQSFYAGLPGCLMKLQLQVLLPWSCPVPPAAPATAAPPTHTPGTDAPGTVAAVGPHSVAAPATTADATLDLLNDLTDDDDEHPTMPTKPYIPQHRDKIPETETCLYACVARPVNKTEIAKTPNAQAALDKEWNALVSAGVWGQNTAREWQDIAREARDNGAKAHVGTRF